MKLLFINPPSPEGVSTTYYRDTNRSGRRSAANELWPQAGLALFAGLYPNHDVKILDCIAERITYSQLWRQMQSFQPDAVIFNPVSCTIESDMALASMAQQVGAKSIAISPHAKALEEETKARFPLLTHAVHHSKTGPEAEYRLREYLTGESAVGTSFEDLPPARQDLLPIQRYSMPFIGKNYTAIIASRGCPYACIYCRTTVVTERRIRYRHVESVLEEIRKYRLTNFILHADTTTINHAWVRSLCKGLRALPFKVRIVSNSRVDTVTLDLLKDMKSAGWWMVSFGIESGDDRVLAMNKKEATVAQAEQAVRWSKAAGLKVWGYFMLGMYGDTPASMQATISLSTRLPLDIVNFSVAAPYPGTEWGQIASSRQWLVETSWGRYDQNYAAIVDQPACGHAEVEQAQRRAYKTWYCSPRGLKFALNAWRPQYTRYLLGAAWNHLRSA